jgi:hypothetical protein
LTLLIIVITEAQILYLITTKTSIDTFELNGSSPATFQALLIEMMNYQGPVQNLIIFHLDELDYSNIIGKGC